MTAQFGMIGLGTMGRNFLLNVAEHGIAGLGYDLDADKRRLLLEEGKGMPLETAEDIPAFLVKLALPRKIMLLVPAGPIVDSVINDLLSHLEPGDIIIDGGNSHFTDTERREESLRQSGVEFLGVGVSGGEEGARHGASIMVGGNPEVYQHVRPILEAASAKVNGEPCAAHVGKGSAGHFVKMVHNGIEYGMMQLIAETFDFMQRGLRMACPEMNRTFSEWNGGDLNSFLIEITADVLRKIDPDTGANLVSVILDTAGQKGTGKWTSQAAMDLGVPIPTIDSAVTMRQISAAKALRVVLSANKSGPRASSDAGRSRTSVSELRDGLLCAFVVTYTQGMSLLNVASVEKLYGLNLSEIARIWRGGCIIRSRFLETIRKAYEAEPSLPTLLLDKTVTGLLDPRLGSLRKAVVAFTENAIPAACFSSSVSYLDAFHTERLPANLIQAQRDYFGAHTYQRNDKDGIFHTPDWA